MKHFLLLFTILLGAAACEHVPSTPPVPPSGETDLKNIVSTTEFTIPAHEGMTAIARNAAGAEIARAAIPTTILIAKDETPVVEYVPTVPGEENVVRTNLWQVIAFEDSNAGDYDYNDLVIHVKYELSGNRFLVGLQPIALGSTKTIRLGCDLWQNGAPIREGIIVADDCRARFFPGTDNRMINTYNVEKEFCIFDYKPYYASNLIPVTDASKPIYVNWFIEVDGATRYYALSTLRTTALLDGKQRPYGLVLTSTGYSYTQQGQGTVGHDWFNYPREGVSIDQVYPLFGKWLRGEYTGSFQSMYDPDASEAYDAIGNGLYEVPANMTSNYAKPSQRTHVIPWNRTQQEIDAFDW